MSSDVAELARRARVASRDLALATRAVKDAVLHAMADALDRRTDEVLEANATDVHRASRSHASLSRTGRERVGTLDPRQVATLES